LPGRRRTPVPGDIALLNYLFWGIIILVCFYLGAQLTSQIRQRKKYQLNIDFEKQKLREKKW
jgi:hypothetical protein